MRVRHLGEPVVEGLVNMSMWHLQRFARMSMSCRRRLRLFAALALFIGATAGAPATVTAYVQDGQRMVYNTNYCYYDSSIPTSWHSSGALANARNAWNNAGSPYRLYYRAGSANYMYASNAGTGSWTARAWHKTHPNPNQPRLHNDCRIQFNTYVAWSTSGSSSAHDVQDNATHEIGHWLRLGDQYSGTNTMCGYSSRGQTFRRTLATDDRNGINYLY